MIENTYNNGLLQDDKDDSKEEDKPVDLGPKEKKG